MLRYALAAIGAAVVIAAAILFLNPRSVGPRPEPRILASGDPATPPGGFTIHDAPPALAPTPAPPATPPADLDAVMQRLRAASGNPSPSPATTPPPAPLPATAPQPATPPAPDPAAPPAPAPPPDPGPRWTSVTGQGTRWRMARLPSGYVVSIDLGGGQTADVHVQPAFGNLDPQAVNVRVDYLRETIMQNFSSQSNSYTFARDGSVSLDH